MPTLEPETLPTPVDVAKTLRVTITAETDDGKKVDGKYTGKHDSGRLVAEFVPETLQRGDSIEWYPPLTIDRQ